MSKSKFDIAKEIIFYAPIGAFNFLKENAPILVSAFVSKGKSIEADKTVGRVESSEPEEVVSDPPSGLVDRTKPIVKSRFIEMTSDVRTAQNLGYTALGTLGFIKDNVSLFGKSFSEKGKKQVAENMPTKSELKSKLSSKTHIVDESPIEEVQDASTGTSVSDQIFMVGKGFLGFTVSTASNALKGVENVCKKVTGR